MSHKLLSTPEIFTQRRKSLEGKIKLTNAIEKYYNFLLKIGIREQKASDLAFSYNFERVLKSKEFSEEEKTECEQIKEELVPLLQFNF